MPYQRLKRFRPLDYLTFILMFILLAVSIYSYYLYLEDKMALEKTTQSQTKKYIYDILEKTVNPVFEAADTLFQENQDSLKQKYIIDQLKAINDTLYENSENLIFAYMVDSNGVVLVSPSKDVEGKDYHKLRRDGLEFHSNIIQTLKIRGQSEFIIYQGRKGKKSYLGYMKLIEYNDSIVGVSKKILKNQGIIQILGLSSIAFFLFMLLVFFRLRLNRYKNDRKQLNELVELKNEKEHLVRNNRMLKMAADKNICPMIVTDTEGAVIWQNERFYEQYGEAIGKHVEYLSHRSKEELDSYQRLAQQNGSTSYTSNVGPPFTNKKIIMNTKVTHFTFDGKDLFIWIDNDITETEKMRSFLRDFLSHDLRNNIERKIISIRYQVEKFISKDMNTNGDNAREVLQNLSPEVQDLNDDLLNYLDWGKLNVDVLQVKESRIELHDLIEREIDKREIFARFCNVNLNFDIPRGLKVFADYTLISSVVRNLIDNAVQAIQKNEKATEREVCFSLEKNETHILVKVKDTGTGLSENEKNELFSQDFRNVSINENIGLGSVICKTFVELNKGKIWVEESTPGKGTTIIFTLPKFLKK